VISLQALLDDLDAKGAFKGGRMRERGKTTKPSRAPRDGNIGTLKDRAHGGAGVSANP